MVNYQDGKIYKIVDNTNGNYIFNLESASQAGSHWVCFLKSKNNIYWFDSFGCPPMQNEVNIFKQNHYNVYYSSVQIQAIKSILCGFFLYRLFIFCKFKRLKYNS